MSAADTPVSTTAPAVVLASASTVRARLLQAAGVPFTVAAAHIDEDEIKRAHRAEGAVALDAATALAEMKARRIAAAHPGTLVIGADQILTLGPEWFDKPADMAHAKAHLRTLSGQVPRARHRRRGGPRRRAHLASCGDAETDHATPERRLHRRISRPRWRRRARLRSAPISSKASARSCSRASTVTSSPSLACRCWRCSRSCASTG